MYKKCVLVSWVLLAAMRSCSGAAVVIDCQRPPQLVDPALCCQDAGRDVVTENCAKRLGITGLPTDAPPTAEAATCLAECILTESHYMPQPEKLNFETIRNDLQSRATNDSVYVQTMLDAFRKCQPIAVHNMQTLKRSWPAVTALPRGCSPYSGILLGCTYMEYFKNCPAHRWTENAECALAKQFVTQCALGASQSGRR